MAIYSVYSTRSNESFSCTNMVSLSEFCGIKYDKLSYHFTRKGKRLYRNEGLIIIKSESLVKCRNRGSGVREVF